VIDSLVAGKLGENRALFYSEEENRIEKFRPYGLPDAEWVGEVTAKFQNRPKPVEPEPKPEPEPASEPTLSSADGDGFSKRYDDDGPPPFPNFDEPTEPASAERTGPDEL